MEKKYTMTITTYEPLSEEEIKARNENSRYRGGMEYMPTPDQPYNMREVRALHVQLTEDEFQAVKRAAVEAIK